MWHDNETTTDLLGFEPLAQTILHLVQNDGLLPLTIGVFGDWGSGKSSLMGMARAQLELDQKYICIPFSPWQYEDYEDVKTALMATVMTTLYNHRSVLQKAEDATAIQTKRLWTKLAKRIDWFRAIGFAGKGLGAAALLTHGNPLGVGLAMSSVESLKHTLRPEQLTQLAEEAERVSKELLKEPNAKAETDTSDQESIEQSIGEFRRDFTELLGRLDIKALVIFIDDLDRCLPATIIDTLEAIRLFLAVPKTTFIIGADQRIMRHAIASRYPEIPGQADIGRDYLEKIVQIPLHIPPLTDSETETYLNLLGCQLYTEPTSYQALVNVAANNRKKTALDVAMNYGIALTHLSQVPAPLEAYMTMISRIAPILCRGLQGNPRQTKRFMNTLLLRMRLAKGRGLQLNQAILAKVMILEYFYEAYFRQLFHWQAEGQGVAAPLRVLEETSQKNVMKDESALPGGGRSWLEDSHIKAWLRLEPSLAAVNLEPYFYFSRDRISTPTAPSRRLSQQLQELLGKLQSESAAERQLGLKEAQILTADELRPVYEILLRRFEQDPRAINALLGQLIVELAVQKREFVPLLAQSFRLAPVGSIQTALPATIKTSFGAKALLPRDLEDVLQGWASQTQAPQLAQAAKHVLEPRRTN